jgi:large subunit ribosomal protein L30
MDCSNLKSTMAKITITLVKSTIHRPKDQKDTVRALGIRKMNGTVEKEITPQILGMVKKIAHLVTTVTEA